MIIKKEVNQFGIHNVINFLNDTKNHEKIAEIIALAIQEEILIAKKNRNATSPTQDRFSNIDVYYLVESKEVWAVNANYSVNYWIKQNNLSLNYDNFLLLTKIELSKKRSSKAFAEAFYNSNDLEEVKGFVKKIIFKDFFLKSSELLLSISNDSQFEDFMLKGLKDNKIPFRFVCDKIGFFKKLTQYSNIHLLGEFSKDSMLTNESFDKFNNLRLDYVNNSLESTLKSEKTTDIESYLKVLSRLENNNLISNLEIITFLNKAFSNKSLFNGNYSVLTTFAGDSLYSLLKTIDLETINDKLEPKIINELKIFAVFLTQYIIESHYYASFAMESLADKILNSFIKIGLSLDEKLVLRSYNFSSFFKNEASNSVLRLFKEVDLDLSNKDFYYFLRVSNEFNFDTESLKTFFNCKKINFNVDFLENCKKFSDLLCYSDFVFCTDDEKLKRNIESFYKRFSK